jgi:hypothetical protein
VSNKNILKIKGRAIGTRVIISLLSPFFISEVYKCDEHMCRDQVELYKTGSKRDACGYKACPFHIE